MAVVNGTANADTVTLTNAQASDTVDLGADYDVLFLPNVVTSVTIQNVEVVVGGTGTDTVTALTMPETVSLGLSGADTFKFAGTDFDLSTTTLVAVEKLQAGLTSATTFTVDQKDLAGVQSIVGTGQDDTLKAAGTELDVSVSQTLSSIEILQAGNAADTTFRVNQKDLANQGTILGNAGNDILITRDATLDLTSTAVNSVEVIRSGVAAATTFTVNANDLADQGSVFGSSGTTLSDTLIVKSTAFDLSSTSLASIEILKAGATNTTFTVDSADLKSVKSVLGTTGTDSLVVADTTVDLSSTTLSSVEVIAAGLTGGTSFTLDTADLASGGSVIGKTGAGSIDTLLVTNSINLGSTTLSDIDILQAATTNNTTFIVDTKDLADQGSVIGSVAAGTNGIDSVSAAGISLDLTSTTLTDIDIIRANSATGTTLTVDLTDLADQGSVLGNTGADTLIVAGTNFDLSSTTLSSVNILKASTDGTTFTLDAADLVSGGSVTGNTGTTSFDVLQATGATLNLSSTILTSIDKLVASTSGTNFTVDTADLASGGSVMGDGTASDTLSAGSTSLDLSSTTLSHVEVLAATKNATTFKVNQADLFDQGTITGNTGTSSIDTLQAADTSLDLSSTTLTSIDVLKVGSTANTTFTVDQADLASKGSVVGSLVTGTNGIDTLAAAGTSLDLTTTTLSNVDVISAGTTNATVFTVDQSDLPSKGSVTGNTGIDTLIINGGTANFASTALTSIDVLQAGLTTGTTFTVNQGDLADQGSVVGVTGTTSLDTLVTASATLDLTSTNLTSIEVLKAGTVGNTVFTVDAADLADQGSVTGSTGTDTLIVNDTATVDLTSTTLTSVEVIQGTGTAGTVFKVDTNDLAAKGSVVGVAGTNSIDTLLVGGASIDLSSTALTSIDVLQAGLTTGTTFKVDSNDLLAGGSVLGVTGATSIDTLTAMSTSIDLTSTTLSSIDVLKAGLAGATTFKVDAADLEDQGSVTGSTGSDTLQVFSTAVDLTSTTLTSVEAIKAGLTTNTVFTVDAGDLASGGSVIGNTGTTGIDTLIVNGTTADLTVTTLSNIDVIQAGLTSGTVFKVDANDLVSGGSVLGADTSGLDTLIFNSTAVNLASTTLSGIDVIQAGKTNSTTFTLDQADLEVGGSVIGNTGTGGIDTLIASTTALDLSSTTLSDIDVLKAGVTNGTTFTVDANDLVAKGSVLGAAVSGTNGIDTLLVNSTTLDLSSTTLSAIDVIKAGVTGGTVFTLDQADLQSGGSLTGALGTNGIDTLIASQATLNLASTTTTGIDVIQAGLTTGTTFTVNQGDLADQGSVVGVTGTTSLDTLVTASATLDLTSTNLTSIEVLKAGTVGNTVFTVDAADLADQGSVTGSTGTDTLIVNDTATVDLTSTTLTSVEVIQGTGTAGTVFKVDTNDLAAKGSVVGVAGTNSIDTLLVGGASIDLSSTALTSIDVLQAGLTTGTTFKVDSNDLLAGGSVLGVTGATSIDTLTAMSTSIDLTSTTLSSIDVLKAGLAGATTFKVDAADLEDQGSVTGSTGSDTLQVFSTAVDLTSTTLTSVEAIKAGLTTNTVFTVDAGDLASGGSVIGNTGTTGIDTLIVNGTTADLTVTTLSNIDVIQAGLTSGTVFKVDANDLVSGGSVLGADTSGLDTLIFNSTAVNLASTTLSGIDVIQAGKTNSTTFTLDQADLEVGGSVIGNTGTGGIDTLIASTTALDLSSTTLSDIDVLKAGVTNGTTFTVDANDLVAKGSVLGAAVSGTNGIDTLLVNSTTLDLSSTTLSAIDVIKAGVTGGTVFTLDQADLQSGGSLTGALGTNGIDTLIASQATLNLASTTTTGIDVIQAGLTTGTTFTVNQGDLADQGSVVGVTGTTSLDTLVTASATLDLTSTNLTSIEVLKAGTVGNTVFTVDAADLADQGSVTGSTGTDTLIVNDTATVDLTSTTLTSVEVIQGTGTAGTVFKVDTNDLAAKGSVVGVAGTNSIDTLLVGGASIDLSSTALTSIDVLQAGLTTGTTFKVDSNDLLAGGSVLGVTGATSIDTLTAMSTSIDLTSTTLSSIDVLKAGLAGATTFKVDAADLEDQGSVTGSTGSDTLQVFSTAVDLTSTTLTSVEAIKAGLTTNTVFTVDAGDLASGGSVIGNTGTTGIDTLIVNGTTADLTVTTLSNIDVIQAGLTSGTVFKVDANDLVSGGSVLGADTSGLDTLIFNSTAVNLASTTLSGIDVIQAGKTNSTTFTLDQADLEVGGSVIGSAVVGSNGFDTLIASTTALDLSSTTLSDIDILKAGSAAGTTFTVDQADLMTNGSVTGSTGFDTLLASGTTLDLSSTQLTSIEMIQAGVTGGTVFTLEQADLASGGSLTGALGTNGIDTLIVSKATLNLASTTTTGIDVIQAGLTTGTTFTVNQGDLADQGSVVGVTGTTSLDTLVAGGAALDLTSTNLTSIEVLKAGTIGNTVFTVDAADLADQGSVFGSTGTDTLIVSDTATVDLTSTTLTSVEVIQGTGTAGTVFKVDTNDLAAKGSVVGVAGTNSIDTLLVGGASIDLSSTALTSIDVLQAGLTTGTTFKVDSNDLLAGGSVLGVTGATSIDTLTAMSTSIDLTSTTLSSIDVLKAGLAGATTFKVDAADLEDQGSVTGSTGSDTLQVFSTAVDLTSTTLTSVEAIKAGLTTNTVFTVDAGDLASGGSVIGNTGTTGIDTLIVNGTTADLTVTTLSNIDVIQAGLTSGTVFKVDANDLVSGGSVLGADTSGLDTLIFNSTAVNLASTTLSGIDVIQAGKTNSTTFTLDQADLEVGGSVIGSAVVGSNGFDTLIASKATLDLSSTTLSDIDILKAGLTTGTTFTVDQGDLVSKGSVLGAAVSGTNGIDTLLVNSTTLDLSSTTLSAIDVIKAGVTGGTVFTLDQADLQSGGSLTGALGTNGIDTLIASQATLNLASTTTTGIDVIQAGLTTGTTFTVNQGDLADQGSVVGVTGTTSLDTLVTASATLDLTSTNLTSIEVLKAGTAGNTVFTVDAADLADQGSVTGSTGTDTLIVSDTATVDLTSTTLSSIEVIQGIGTAGTVFKVDASDLAAKGSVVGVAGTNSIDTLLVGGATIDLSSTQLTSIDVLQAGLTTGTTFKVDSGDLISGGSVLGVTGATSIDSLVTTGTSLDLTSTTLSSIDVLVATKTGTVFKVDAADLVDQGSVIGTTGTDTLQMLSTAFDLTSTTLSSVEKLQALATDGTVFTVDTLDLASGGSILGSAVSGTSGFDTLLAGGTSLNLASTMLSAIDVIQAGTSATTFTLDTADLFAGGSVIGSDTNTIDTLVAAGATLDLSSTTLTGFEVLQAAAAGSAFTVDVADLVSGGSVLGGAGIDTLTIRDTAYDLSSTTLSSIDILKAGSSLATTFTIDNVGDLVTGGSVVGSSGGDTLFLSGTALDLTSTTLTSIETLRAGTTNDTLFTVDQSDLAKGGNVIGHNGNDTLTVDGTSFDLSSTTLVNVEILKTNVTTGTTFTIDGGDLDVGGSIMGTTNSTDTLIAASTDFDLTGTTLSSIEILVANKAGTTFTLDADGIGLDINGAAGADKFGFVSGYDVDFTNTTSLNNTVANITNFNVSTAGEVIDIAGLVQNGLAQFVDSTVVQATANGAGADELARIQAVAASLDGSFDTQVAVFQTGGDVWVLIDNTAGALGTNDQVIKLTGVNANTFLSTDFILS